MPDSPPVFYIGLFDRGFGAVAFTLVVEPGNLDLVTRRAALEFERHVRILGNAAAPVRGHDDVAIVLGADLGDVVGRNLLAGFGIFSQTGFHGVAHQRLDRGYPVLCLRANFDCSHS